MSDGSRSRAFASVFAVAAGFIFVWVTIEILRADPERRLLVLWLLSFVLSIVTAGVVVFMYTRSSTEKSRARKEADTLMSAVERGRRLHSVD